VTPDPADEIARALQAVQQPGESIRRGPGGALYLGDRRFLLAKYNPMQQRATIVPIRFEEVGEVRVVSGSESRSFVEIGRTGDEAGGISGGDEAEYAQRPNVIYCGRGAEAEQMAHQIVRAVNTAVAPPPPPPPPPPEPEPQTFPADWYADPHGQHRLRYYDGTQWTEHVAD
jgi:hypothetical protein